jgi:hypothetical protein
VRTQGFTPNTSGSTSTAARGAAGRAHQAGITPSSVQTCTHSDWISKSLLPTPFHQADSHRGVIAAK